MKISGQFINYLDLGEKRFHELKDRSEEIPQNATERVKELGKKEKKKRKID